MPRKQGSQNSTNFHYKVTRYDNADKENVEEELYFKTQSDISKRYGINRSSIYFIVNPDDTRLSKKWQNFTIEKLSPPIPIFQLTPTFSPELTG
tara:strand:- start:161 stop:442 length:282 start_codon:yes stop_codon:yes gene_type:complete